MDLEAVKLLHFLPQIIFPGTKGYTHFRFPDYAKLTTIGVIIAGMSWPIVTRLTYAPKWLFLRLAVLVTLVLLLPDIYIIHAGQSLQAVAILIIMHFAIALVTYNLLVRVAPVRPAREAGQRRAGDRSAVRR